MLKHGNARRSSRTPEYRAWDAMIHRCERPSEKRYHRYGGRGIKVCERWRVSFEAFLEDMGPRPSTKHSIDRRNPNGNYEPGNCRWATAGEQQINRSNNKLIEWRGVTKCAAEWERELGLRRGTLCNRMNSKGMSVEKAMSLPPKARRIN